MRASLLFTPNLNCEQFSISLGRHEAVPDRCPILKIDMMYTGSGVDVQRSGPSKTTPENVDEMRSLFFLSPQRSTRNSAQILGLSAVSIRRIFYLISSVTLLFFIYRVVSINRTTVSGQRLTLENFMKVLYIVIRYCIVSDFC